MDSVAAARLRTAREEDEEEGEIRQEEEDATATRKRRRRRDCPWPPPPTLAELVDRANGDARARAILPPGGTYLPIHPGCIVVKDLAANDTDMMYVSFGATYFQRAILVDPSIGTLGHVADLRAGVMRVRSAVGKTTSILSYLCCIGLAKKLLGCCYDSFSFAAAQIYVFRYQLVDVHELEVKILKALGHRLGPVMPVPAAEAAAVSHQA